MAQNSTSSALSTISLQEGQHIEIQHRGQLPFRYLGQLGRGASATVETVEERTTGRQFAHKYFGRIPVKDFRNFKATFKNEIDIIKRLQPHSHIINVFTSYSCGRELGILLLPVANGGDLQCYLQDIKDMTLDGGTINEDQTAILKRSFGCLASGLAFIHKHTIRHKDIKPSNILLHNDRVVYTDFGIAFDAHANQDDTTTTGFPGPHTNRFCAPEVANARPRNRKSDVFSLGCVFLEIFRVLLPTSKLGITEDWVYWQKVELDPDTFAWLQFYRVAVPTLSICFHMLKLESADRISADKLLAYFHDVQRNLSYGEYRVFCDDCAVAQDGGTNTIESRLRYHDNFSSIFRHFKPMTCFFSREEAIREIAIRSLGVATKEVNLDPYILASSTSNFGYIKTGVAPNAAREATFWALHYNLKLHICDLNLTGPRLELCHRLKDLIFAELREYQYEDRDCFTCRGVHDGWFRTTPEHAARVIEKFYNWIQSGPYVKEKGKEGRLKLSDHAKMAQLDQLCEPLPVEVS